MAIAALVFGIVGVCCCIGLLGIVFGKIAKDQIAITGESGDGMATAGIVLGCISIVPTLIWMISRFSG
jgi:ABC-type phosphate transport system permease subunit